MGEHQVTVDGVTYPLPQPFMVLATQNPIEYEGTFPLPEAQLDRFMLRINLGYPAFEDEVRVLERQQFRHPVETLEAVTTIAELRAAQEQIKDVYLSPAVKQYLVKLTRRTRDHPDVFLGASPRGSLTLYRTAQARAAIHGRAFVLPDDIKALAQPALAHRIILAPGARMREQRTGDIVEALLDKIPSVDADTARR